MKERCCGLLLAVLCLGGVLSGCNNASSNLESDLNEISAYNQSVEHIVNSYDSTKSLGDELCGDIRVFITTNVISDKLYSAMDLSGVSLKKNEGESDTAFKARKADELYASSTVLDAYKEWQSDENTFDWVFTNTYIWKNNYYVSVASEYTRQFMVIKATDSNATAIASIFWKDNKIVKMMVSHYE